MTHPTEAGERETIAGRLMLRARGGCTKRHYTADPNCAAKGRTVENWCSNCVTLRAADLLEAEEESGAKRTPRFCPRCHEPMERATGEDAKYGDWRCDHDLEGKRLYYDYELDLIYRPEQAPEPEPEEGEPDVEISPEQLERLRQGGVEDSIRRRMLIRHDKTIRGLEERIEALEERVEIAENVIGMLSGAVGAQAMVDHILSTPEPDSEPEPEPTP